PALPLAGSDPLHRPGPAGRSRPVRGSRLHVREDLRLLDLAPVPVSCLLRARPRFSAMTSTYLMESAREAARLEAKTDPGETRRQLRLVGLREGTRARAPARWPG